jgi:ribosome-associated toxin RatA of RatAB toxin-antitoxin module
MAEVVREKIMNVPSQALFRAITEFEKYPEFLGEVTGAKVVKKVAPDKVQVQFEIEVVKTFVYTLEFQVKGEEEIRWKLLESDFFKKNEGRWLLKAKGAKETEVHYELDVAVVFLIPSWIAKKLTEVNLPKMFESFETRAKELAG